MTHNGKTANCVLWEGQWFCNYPNGGGWTLSPTNINFCGECTEESIKDGSCGTCWSGERQCPVGTYNSTLQRCVFQINGDTISCDFNKSCYYGDQKNANRCCWGWDQTDNGTCAVGICNKKHCTDQGLEFAYMQGRYGCQSTHKGYKVIYDFSGWNSGYANPCYLADTGKLCGANCDEACSSCRAYYHEACAPEGVCVPTGSLVEGCTCAGSISTDENGKQRCCETGHIYVNGGCTLPM